METVARDLSDETLHARTLAALRARAGLLAALHADDTDAYRLLHGVSEGASGLTVDRYGPLLLAQEFRGTLAPTQRLAVAAALETVLPGVAVVWRPRGVVGPPSEVVEARELGARYAIAAQHRGQDPWLFLDFRCVRRWLRAHAADRSVLNLFGYTGTAAIAAALGGAREVWNVDFAASALEVARDNTARNGVTERVRLLQADCLPVLRQLAGQNVQRRGKAVPFVTVARRTFDLVVLDPPPLAKSPFGTVDTRTDYEGLFKPALLATSPGGIVVAANNRADVAWEDFERRLARCAEKAGRPLRSLERLLPEADFPSFDGEPPLKVALCAT